MILIYLNLMKFFQHNIIFPYNYYMSYNMYNNILVNELNFILVYINTYKHHYNFIGPTLCILLGVNFKKTITMFRDYIKMVRININLYPYT